MESKVYFFSRNRKVRDSSLHAKNNPEKHKEQFPFNSSQEIRFYESCGFIIFQGEIFCLTKGHRVCNAHFERAQIIPKQRANSGFSAKAKVTITRRGSNFHDEDIEKNRANL